MRFYINAMEKMKKLAKIIIIIITLIILLPTTIMGEQFDWTLPVYIEWMNLHYPIAQGVYVEWAGTYADINDDWKNSDDSDYISTSTDSANMSFIFTPWNGAATISSISVTVRAKKIFSADGIELYYYAGGLAYNAGSLLVTGSFSNLSTSFSTNPATGNAWTVSEINSMQWLVRKTGTAGLVYVSQIYVQVIPATIDGQTTLSNLGLYTNLDVQNIIDTGFASSSFLNTYLTDTNGYMPVTDRLGFEISSISAFETKTTNLRLNYAPAQTNFSIIPGYSGNITIAHNANIEPTSNFTYSMTGYLNTDYFTNKELFNKNGAIRTYIGGSQNITVDVVSASQNMTFGYAPVVSGVHTINVTGDGSYFRLWVDGVNVTSVSQAVVGTQTTNNTYTNANGDVTTIATLFGAATHWEAVNSSDDSTSYVKTGVYPDSGTDYYSIAAPFPPILPTDTILSISVTGRWNNTSGVGGENAGYTPILRLNSTNTTGITKNATFAYADDTQTLARPGGGPWTYADLADLQVGATLQTYDAGNECRLTFIYATVTYKPMVTASIIDNSSGYLVADNNTFPYLTNMSISVGSPLVEQLAYMPNTLISGSTLIDLDGGDNNGTIVYGANPSGITVWVGTTSSTTSYASTTITTDMPSHMFVSPPGVDSTGGTVDVEEELKDLMFYETFRIAGEKLGLSTAAMFSIFLISLATGLGFLASILVGLPIIGIITSAGVLSMGLQNQIIPLWFIITFLILAISMLYLKGRM